MQPTARQAARPFRGEWRPLLLETALAVLVSAVCATAALQPAEFDLVGGVLESDFHGGGRVHLHSSVPISRGIVSAASYEGDVEVEMVFSGFDHLAHGTAYQATMQLAFVQSGWDSDCRGDSCFDGAFVAFENKVCGETPEWTPANVPLSPGFSFEVTPGPRPI